MLYSFLLNLYYLQVYSNYYGMNDAYYNASSNYYDNNNYFNPIADNNYFAQTSNIVVPTQTPLVQSSTSTENESTKQDLGKQNLRRELTEREKVELEMKKWQKEQKKVSDY
jgi:hypothetical protein